LTSSLVSPKNQEQCGCCWAFSAAGALESNYQIKHGGSPISLSEQQLVSCDTTDDGCDGGLSNYAFRYVKTNGIELEANYPFTSASGSVAKCKYTSTKATYKNTGYNYCTNDDTTGETNSSGCSLTQWQAYLAKGPFSVYMEADSNDFQNYASGVLTLSSSDCSNGSDHAVLAVGWGTANGVQFVLVRNSWGTSWGESGYFRIAYSPSTSDTCYITGSAFQPTF